MNRMIKPINELTHTNTFSVHTYFFAKEKAIIFIKDQFVKYLIIIAPFIKITIDNLDLQKEALQANKTIYVGLIRNIYSRSNKKNFLNIYYDVYYKFTYIYIYIYIYEITIN